MKWKSKKSLYANLPDSPGVYLMRGASDKILYIGKAGNLRRRVSSYFLKGHEYRIERLVKEIQKIDYRKTDTALEALILEAELIKKYQPPYNVLEKDDKSFPYVEITNESFPRVLLTRGKSLALSNVEGRGHDAQHPQHTYFGPFTAADSLRQALKILRRIFPWSTHQISDVRYRISDNESQRKNKRPCFDYEIGLCPGTCIDAISRHDYLKNIRNLKLVFRGRKKELLRSLKREMRAASKALEFERAKKLKRQIFGLQHIQDIALLNEPEPLVASGQSLVARPRIEGYDISNISGTSAVGSMVVFIGDKPDKNEYRKFRIKTIHQSDDVGMIKEVLRCRFARAREGRRGWTLPSLILIDGGKPQVNAAQSVLEEYGMKIPVVGIAKGPTRKKNELIGRAPPGISEKTLIRVRDEAHRFAIRYHRELRAWKSLVG